MHNIEYFCCIHYNTLYTLYTLQTLYSVSPEGLRPYAAGPFGFETRLAWGATWHSRGKEAQALWESGGPSRILPDKKYSISLNLQFPVGKCLVKQIV